MLLMAAPANADITTSMSSSVQLTVNAAATQATRIGSSYAVSGSNITATTFGGLTAPASTTAAATQIQGSYDITLTPLVSPSLSLSLKAMLMRVLLP